MKTTSPYARGDQDAKRPEWFSRCVSWHPGLLSIRRHRPGTTLVELLIFLAIMAMVVSVTLPMLFTAAENRLLQQTVSVVEQNGTQAVQNIGLKVRNAETVVYPAAGQTAKYLVLQTGSGTTNPIIIGALSGAVVIIQRSTKETITTEQVGVDQFRVRNTSTSATSQSVSISFRASRTIRLQSPRSYTQRFDATFGLLPDDRRTGACNCPPASCASNALTWYMCDTGVCEEATTALECS